MAYDIVSAYLRKSASRLKSAQVLIDKKCYEEAVGAAYYAIFHAISALLAVKGLNYDSHKGTISNFNKTYVHTGLIGSISARALSDLHNKRNECEYDPTVFTGEDGAREALQLAQAAVQDILDYCKANNIGVDNLR